MPAPQVTFIPSASATLTCMDIPSLVTLPAADPSNTAVVLRNLGPGDVWLSPSKTAPAGVLNGMPGVVRLAAGQTQLVTTSPGFAMSTVAVIQGGNGTNLSFYRGSTADIWLFPAPGAAVF